ncbi:DUF3592 domain-containing protein [Spirosoma sp.]|uniref:DUF3592 domain-containing protein n=1 Tax=Spirosoma sp. TaxID=1899569 RepID=UPI003B3BE9C9
MLRLLLLIDTIALLIGTYSFTSGRIPATPSNIFIAVFGFVGISMVIGSLITFQNTRTWIDRTDTVTGEVIDYESHASYDTEKNRTTTFYHPTVHFRTHGGEDVTFTSSVGSSKRSHSIGGQIGVRYLPSDPGDAQVDEFMSLWLVPIVLSAIGLPMSFVSLGLAFSIFKV